MKAIDRLTEAREQELVRQLAERISWLSRPALIEYLTLLLRCLRYHHIKEAKGLTGVDLTAQLSLPGGVTKTHIRVRDYGPIGLNSVDELRGAMQRTNIRFGIIFTTKTFTQPALALQNAVPGYAVSLIDLNGIAKLSLTSGLGTRKLQSSRLRLPTLLLDEMLFDMLEHER